MKKNVVYLLIMICLLSGCTNTPAPTTAQTSAMIPIPTASPAQTSETAAIPSDATSENDSEDTLELDENFDFEAFMEEYERLQERMAPKKLAIEEKIEQLLPEEYTNSELYYASAEVWNDDLFIIDVQIDLPGADIEKAKIAMTNVYWLLKPLEEELSFTCEIYMATIVDGDKIIAFLSSTDVENQYSLMLEDGSESTYIAK